MKSVIPSENKVVVQEVEKPTLKEGEILVKLKACGICGSDPEKVELLLRVATAIVLAEVTARQSGVRQAGQIRKNINEYLRDALSKP